MPLSLIYDLTLSPYSFATAQCSEYYFASNTPAYSDIALVIWMDFENPL